MVYLFAVKSKRGRLLWINVVGETEYDAIKKARIKIPRETYAGPLKEKCFYRGCDEYAKVLDNNWAPKCDKHIGVWICYSKHDRTIASVNIQ